MMSQPQRVRSTASSRSFISLRTSFAQIRRIAPSNTFAVLATCYVKHQIDQMNSDMLWHNSVQITKQVKGTFLPPGTFTACLLAVQATKQAKRTSTIWHFYGLLYKLPNRPDGLPPSGTLTTCCTSYQTGQTDFHPLALLRLA